jgi:hypothetical protein
MLQLKRSDPQEVASPPDEGRPAPMRVSRAREDGIAEQILPVTRKFLPGHHLSRE